MVCPHEQCIGEGLFQCGYFSAKGKGMSIFRDFVRTSFMDGPLLEFPIFPIPYLPC